MSRTITPLNSKKIIIQEVLDRAFDFFSYFDHKYVPVINLNTLDEKNKKKHEENEDDSEVKI